MEWQTEMTTIGSCKVQGHKFHPKNQNLRPVGIRLRWKQHRDGSSHLRRTTASPSDAASPRQPFPLGHKPVKCSGRRGWSVTLTRGVGRAPTAATRRTRFASGAREKDEDEQRVMLLYKDRSCSFNARSSSRRQRFIHHAQLLVV